MSEPAENQPKTKSLGLRYLWPTPTGVFLWVTAMAIAKFMGQRAFLNVHALFEIGILVAMVASVVYSIRLSGEGRSLAPRWVFILNLMFGPLIIGIFVVSRIVSLLSSIN